MNGLKFDLAGLEKVARAVPEHLIHTGWQRTKDPVFGQWCIYADDGRGMGRQHVANTPAMKSYGFTDLSAFIATFDPPTVLTLIAALRAAMAEEVGPLTAAEYNERFFDPANEAGQATFDAGFREGFLFAMFPEGYDDAEDMAEAWRAVDGVVLGEAWQAHRDAFFARLPLKAVPPIPEAKP